MGRACAPPTGSTLAGGDIEVNVHAGGYEPSASGTATRYTPTYADDASNAFLQCNAITNLCNNTAGSSFSGVLAGDSGDQCRTINQSATASG
jgi:hypothetical protein